MIDVSKLVRLPEPRSMESKTNSDTWSDAFFALRPLYTRNVGMKKTSTEKAWVRYDMLL